jgi:hypothetical protein
MSYVQISGLLFNIESYDSPYYLMLRVTAAGIVCIGESLLTAGCL